MESSQIQNKINEFFEKLFAGTEIQFKIEFENDVEQNHLLVKVKSTDDNLLIGYHGNNITALQHYLRVMVNNASRGSLESEKNLLQKGEDSQSTDVAKDADVDAESFVYMEKSAQSDNQKLPRTDLIDIVLDIGTYREDRKNKTVRVAEEALEKARLYKKTVALYPMSSYERKIVHEIVGQTDDLTSASEGEGANRRVVISFKE